MSGRTPKKAPVSNPAIGHAAEQLGLLHAAQENSQLIDIQIPSSSSSDVLDPEPSSSGFSFSSQSQGLGLNHDFVERKDAAVAKVFDDAYNKTFEELLTRQAAKEKAAMDFAAAYQGKKRKMNFDSNSSSFARGGASTYRMSTSQASQAPSEPTTTTIEETMQNMMGQFKMVTSSLASESRSRRVEAAADRAEGDAIIPCSIAQLLLGLAAGM